MRRINTCLESNIRGWIVYCFYYSKVQMDRTLIRITNDSTSPNPRPPPVTLLPKTVVYAPMVVTTNNTNIQIGTHCHKTTVLWNVAPASPIELEGRFKGTEVAVKNLWRLHSAISQQKVIFILAAVRTRNVSAVSWQTDVTSIFSYHLSTTLLNYYKFIWRKHHCQELDR
jgi:hypothetical protein